MLEDYICQVRKTESVYGGRWGEVWCKWYYIGDNGRLNFVEKVTFEQTLKETKENIPENIWR